MQAKGLLRSSVQVLALKLRHVDHHTPVEVFEAGAGATEEALKHALRVPIH